jgi:hypothetical protein
MTTQRCERLIKVTLLLLAIALLATSAAVSSHTPSWSDRLSALLAVELVIGTGVLLALYAARYRAIRADHAARDAMRRESLNRTGIAS